MFLGWLSGLENMPVFSFFVGFIKIPRGVFQDINGNACFVFRFATKMPAAFAQKAHRKETFSTTKHNKSGNKKKKSALYFVYLHEISAYYGPTLFITVSGVRLRKCIEEVYGCGLYRHGRDF